LSNRGLLSAVIALAREAGSAIRAFAGGVQAEFKADDSPVTAADRAAHDVLSQGLAEIGAGMPVFSEEAEVAWQTRRHWQRYWLVDPLDGTREFLLGSDEFTVNVALVDDGRPVLGVILQPVTGLLWAGCTEGAETRAFREDGEGRRAAIACRQLTERTSPIRALVSRHYQSEESPRVVAALGGGGGVDIVAMGSALKFCRIAEGSADVYLRTAPTAEWDTAAGQAIIEAAGGGVFDMHGRALRYNQDASVLNPGFFAIADMSLRSFLGGE